MGKKTTRPACPKCGAKLRWDGKGLDCTKCLYFWRPDKRLDQGPPPEITEEEERPKPQ